MNRIMAPMVVVLSGVLVACSSPAHKAAPAPVGQQSVAQLTTLALATSDLPFGWAVSPPASVSSVTAPCAALTTDGSMQLPAQAESDFQQSEDGPFVQEILASGAAQPVHDAWAAVQKEAIACSAVTSGIDTTRLSTMAFPSYGDESYALQLAVSRSGVNYGGDVVVIRKGQVFVEVAVFGVDGVSASLVKQLVDTATKKAL
ncbi:hypothetical protein Caci_1418 [Catenulispora acidiphila DSM 44928]|uniref:PknH-like extracellular domain-containing protein n=1 Tax=Catenulispora acidiphila (strain DSM 44928 / JCM 14897 / NBRC 102108 / NRRL B-24433 / ID139908) TaxID=479433 RepID=C7Q8S6_CATAD|nr:hypothetical protein [Catenulispora acidiphila]ACU70341.1 hypothetical protein Caci_1418 [Catenulispora acidiphila DSM 44928]